MAHSSSLRWESAEAAVGQSAFETINLLDSAEKTYQDLLEVYNYSGGTVQSFADLLFADVIAQEGRNPAVASVDEVARVTDLSNAITALHQLYLFANNNTVVADDRYAKLRRLS